MHAPLFTAPVLLVEQPHQLYAHEGHYEVLSESGHPLAYVNEHMTAWSHRQGSHHPHRFTIYGPDGYPLLTLDKPWDRGRPYIHVTGPHGEPYGSIVQDRSFMGSRFRLNDPRGHTIAEIRGDWGGWDFTILDHAGIEIARIGKEHPGLAGGFFTTDDRYALEFAYDLPWPLRRLVIGAAITIDVLLHEREPDFYHSHYADFHRYPEYGYEPRHHWHHPRRGYVLARRVRRPVAVHEFRPVRRRGYVPVRERPVEARRAYRTFGSRSEAPNRSAAPRRTARVDRSTASRSGGGFASRSGSAARRGGGFASRSEAAGRRDRSNGASRSESPSSGAAARRERRTRGTASRQSPSFGRSGSNGRSGGSTSRAGGVFGGSSGSSPSSRSGSKRAGASSRSSSSRASSKRAGGSSSRASSGRSGGASRAFGGFRGSGGGRAGSSSRRSSGGGRSRGRSGGRSSRNR